MLTKEHVTYVTSYETIEAVIKIYVQKDCKYNSSEAHIT